MTQIRRFNGWTINPTFVVNSASRPVSLAIDDSRLTQWIGEPASVWQTPLTEVRNLELQVGRRRLVLRATIAGTRYTWRTTREEHHDEFIELVRNKGGRIIRPHRARTASVLTTAAVLLIASGASIVSWLTSSNQPSASELGKVNVQRTDLPGGWHIANTGLAALLAGPAYKTYTFNTVPPKLTGMAKKLTNAVVGNYERCMGVDSAHDRLFGSGGEAPVLQVSGDGYATTTYGGAEIASSVQFYSSRAKVQRDINNYSSPKFGRCYAQYNAQSINGIVRNSVAAANVKFATTNYAPFTLAHGFRRGGMATITLPGAGGTVSILSVFVAVGQEEGYFFAVSGHWPKDQGVVLEALSALLARMGGAGSSSAA